MSDGIQNAPPAAPPVPDQPSPLAVIALILGIASWMVGCCVSVPAVGLAVAELLLIRKGKSSPRGKLFAWFGLLSSLLHAVISVFALLVLGTTAAALLYFGSVPFTEPCKDREVCAEEGQCGTSYEVAGEGIYRCYVRDETDCRRATACAREGRCTYDPRVSLACIEPGRAPVVPPPATSVCAHSSDCARWGRCALLEGACLAVRDDDCRRSLDCIVQGKCTLRGKHCVAMSDDDCAGSLECEVYGRCRLDDTFGGLSSTCVAPGERYAPSCNFSGADADRCAQTGECLRSPQGVCESLAAHGRRSPRLEEVRRRILEAVPVDKPTNLR